MPPDAGHTFSLGMQTRPSSFMLQFRMTQFPEGRLAQECIAGAVSNTVHI